MKKTITESQIKAIITKVLKEAIEQQSNPFSYLESDVRERMGEAENEIETLQNKIKQLEQVIPAFQEANNEIKSRFPNIQGPQPGKYRNSFMYILSSPVNYDEESDSYGDVDEIEDDIKNCFPEEIQKAISVLAQDDRNNNYARTGFQISIDLDDLKG